MRRILFIVFLLSGCAPDSEQALRALHAVGLKNPKLGLYPFFKCGKGDNFNIEFTAYTREGTKVTGAVCCGMFKNCTVRFD